MAWTYRLSVWRRAVNRAIGALVRLGLGPPRTYLLAVRGRASGRVHSTPVTLVESGGQRWLVAPYGEVAWVRNARAAGRATLSRGRRSESVSIVELGPEAAAPVLKRYLSEVPVTRPFFDVRIDSSLEEFAREAPRHPVFRIVSAREAPPTRAADSPAPSPPSSSR